ncbi:hypothetical protein HNQ74_000843 [Bartonella doshiae]|uniref:Uncharacterized protein n=2 Tax=Bartonella doshiae TaxID=33044 RepID=A0A380ZDG7_BARDO|nr:hypothetical protein MCS_00297 [Bartonella doshiae NCTC 12862 = ATCC 700133]MBB6159417.1 hypothetical protein [Bartonella doshiae]SUV44701.1 Uncharacterised protein [Bartonella doshiae]
MAILCAGEGSFKVLVVLVFCSMEQVNFDGEQGG